MDVEVVRLTREVQWNGPVDWIELERVEGLLGFRFPAEYREFLRETGGGEGPVGREGWVRFGSLAEVLQENADAHAEAMFDLFDGLVVFGGNGAGDAYCFDAEGRIWRASWVSAREDHTLVGSLIDFLRAQDRGL